MSELKFTSKKNFNELTQCIHLIMTQQEEIPTLNQMRQLIAKDHGYKSLQAYQATNYVTASRLPENHMVNAQLTRNDFMLLTNSDYE
jgi:hypothetical protein